MQIERLIYFIEAYNERSVTKAGKNCNVTQQTISVAIKELENDLRSVLFHRSKNGLTPTPYCEEIYPHILKIVQDWQTLLHPENENNQPIIDGIKVFIPTTLCPFTIDIFEKFSPQFPKVNVFLKEYIPSVEHLDALFEQNTDFIIYPIIKEEFNSVLLAKYPNYTQFVLFMDTIVAITGDQSPYAKYKSMPKKALKEWPWIFYNTEDCSAIATYNNIFDNAFPRSYVQTDNFNLFFNAIAKHNYIGITTNLIKKSNIYKQERLKTIQLPNKIHFCYICAVNNRGKNKPHIQQMQDIIQKLFTP